jgi:hypothetical protein
MANTRDERGERIGGNPAPVQPDVKETKGARNRTAGNPAPEPSRWPRPIADFNRRESKTYAVMRYG